MRKIEFKIITLTKIASVESLSLDHSALSLLLYVLWQSSYCKVCFQSTKQALTSLSKKLSAEIYIFLFLNANDAVFIARLTLLCQWESGGFCFFFLCTTEPKPGVFYPKADSNKD